MSVESFHPNSPMMTITDKAAAYFAHQLDENDEAAAIRFSVKRSGCTGYKYDINLAKQPEENDITLTVNTLPVYIDPKAVSALQGLEIDYVLEGINRSVKFINPNAKAYCGCGESFSLDNE